MPAQVIGKQILRSGTSIGAQYREGIRADRMRKSSANGIVHYKNLKKRLTAELLVEASIVPAPRLSELMAESNELAAMLTASVITIRNRK